MKARAAAARSQPQLDGEAPHGTYYSDYLQLDSLLSIQEPMSLKEDGTYAHEELLFITVHQSHELWFKLIITDLTRVHGIMSKAVAIADPLSPPVEADLARAISSLERIKAIQPMLLQKLTVLETMTPMEFLEFRDYLVPASGFQSWQFRIIETLLGLSTKDRPNMSHEFMKRKLRKEDYEKIVVWDKEPSLVDLTEIWLEQMPWLRSPNGIGGFDWTRQYRETVYELLDSEEETMRSVFHELNLESEILESELDQVRSNRASFDSLFDADQHAELVSRGVRKFSQKAILNAIFAYLYRDLTALHSPFRFLTLLVEIDDGFTSWRYRHAQMAHRMIGRKMGTGATSGADHLMRVAQQNCSFKDLRNISTFLIPTSRMPPLPPTVLSVLRNQSSQ
jgi:tryptophan 2,3-dioxygenase